MADLTEHMQALSDELVRLTDTDTLDRAQMRTRLFFEMFYDDEPGEPHQVIQDVITDLAHIAEERSVDIIECFWKGVEMYNREREEWAERERN